MNSSTSNTKLVAQQEQWNLVTKELEAENLKLMSYDRTLISLCGNLTSKKVLDYGAGPGVLALAVKKLGGDIQTFDINEELNGKAGEKIGPENVYSAPAQIPNDYYDIIICNLVLCIVPEVEVETIVQNLKSKLKQDGKLLIGFCNPGIFQIKESQLDFRFPTGANYDQNHQYKKIKKEGGYEIIEDHRPTKWYKQIYTKAGLTLIAEHYTPEYELNGNKIKDFIVFELTK
jgi:2-polyprenyl-3-methyl-5-hydroxy-6-metoxy-1,4-benzoquinol methylase